MTPTGPATPTAGTTATANPAAIPFVRVGLWAALISMVALATDIMLPALGLMGPALGVPDDQPLGSVVTAMFLGFAAGQVVVGSLADAVGRRPVVLGGLALFAVGCVVSMTATSLPAMLAGRVLQGLGAAAPRVVVTAIVRDGLRGDAMARVMSIVMAVFVLVPTIAPALGQAVLFLGDWRLVFAALGALAGLTGLWFALAQPETLPPDRRRPFSLRGIAGGFREVLAMRGPRAHILALGAVFGPFVGYLGAAQHLFQDVYRTGTAFAGYFAVAALAIGAASLGNARLVERLGAARLVRRAFAAMAGLALAAGLLSLLLPGPLPLWGFMLWLVPTFGCVGFLFGNLSALALEPLGARAGLGAAVVGSVSTLLSLPVAVLLAGISADGPAPLVWGFAVAGLAGLALVARTRRDA